MNKLLIIMTTLFGLNFSLFAKSTLEQLPTASHVDVAEYVGKWYAITSLPQIFTKSCESQTAQYAVLDSKTISVLNTCYKANGKTTTINGKATVVNSVTNAKLQVVFDNFWTKLFNVKGDYTIIKLEADYSTVLVGSNDRKSLWILSRTPYMNEDLKTEYIAFAKSVGFDTSKLVDSKF